MEDVKPGPHTRPKHSVPKRHQGPQSKANRKDTLNQTLCDELDEQFDEMSFKSIEQQNRRDAKTEAFAACLNIKLPQKIRDPQPKGKSWHWSGRENTPLRIFQKMFPEKNQLRWITTF